MRAVGAQEALAAAQAEADRRAGEAEAVRAELAAANAREQELRHALVDETDAGRKLKALEQELERRDAQTDADTFIREDKLEERERELAELAARIERRERDIASYVGQLQGKVQLPDDSAWWAKQLGTKEEQPAA
jgi:chromosome segregation ATPase